MKRVFLTAVIGALLLIPAVTTSASADSGDGNLVFSAWLTGPDEVDSDATAAAIFTTSADGLTLTWEIQGQGLSADIALADIHFSGPHGVVLFLIPDVAPGTAGGSFDFTGTATAADLIGDLKGHSLHDLITAMKAGSMFANLDTVSHLGILDRIHQD